MIAWYSRARSSFSKPISFSREIGPAPLGVVAIMISLKRGPAKPPSMSANQMPGVGEFPAPAPVCVTGRTRQLMQPARRAGPREDYLAVLGANTRKGLRDIGNRLHTVGHRRSHWSAVGCRGEGRYSQRRTAAPC